MPDIYASFDKPVVEKDRPFWSDTYEVGRQIGAGVAVDLPRMVGQGIRRVSRDGGMVDELARSVVESADERAAGWEPDMRGRGLVAETLIKGGRAVGPMGPAIAASLNPFGMYTGPAVAGALFGTSAAQNTEDKLRLQGVPDDRATEAGIYTGLVQGPSEAVGTALGLRFMKAAAPLNPFAKPPGMGGFVERATDTAVLKPFAQNFGLNLLGQPATEVAQDGTTELIERGYGAAPEDLWDIAKNSAQSAVGLTALLGPFGAASQVGVSRRNEALRGALQSEDPTTRLAAIDALTTQAKKQGVAPAEIEAWRVEQLQPPAPPTRGPATNFFADAESINVPTQFSPGFVDQSLGLRFPQPGATKSRMSDVEAALSEPTNMYAVSQPDQYEQRLDAGQVAALQAGQLEDDANKQAEAKYAAKRTAATDTLVDKEPDGTLPIKVKPREIETHDTLTTLKDAGTITPEVYADMIGRVREALKANDSKTLNTVNKEAKALAAPAPAAPAAPATPVGAPAPTAPTEPVNQLLQGQPDVSNAALVGGGSEQRGTGGGAVAGTSVAPAGRGADAAVGNNPATDGVAALGGQAGAVSNAEPGVAPTVVEAAPDVVTGVGDPNVAVTTKKTRKAAFGTDERRADILARIKAEKAAPSKLSGIKLKQGGAIDVELLALYTELAVDHIVKTGKNFAEFASRMVSDLGEEVEPYLRRLHTAAQDEIRKTTKPVAVERTADGAPVMLESRDADGKVVGYTVKLKGKVGAYLRRDAQSGQLVLVPERSGLTKQDSPVYLGENLDEALDELPFAYGLIKSGRKIAEASGKTAVEFEPKNKAVVGGAIDFNLLQQATEGKPQYLKSIYLYLGIDKDGTRLMGKPMSANAAAREGGWGKNSGQNLTKAMNALGITDAVMNRFMQSDQMALPLPGEAMPLSIRERLEQGAEQEEEGRDQYVDDTADSRDEDTRQIEEGARGAGAFEDESNIGTEDSRDGSVLERFNEGISTISSVGGSTMGTEKTLTTRVSASKQFKALAEAVKQQLPLDSFPTEELLAGFHKVSKHILPDQLDGSESQTVIDNAYANDEFMFGLLAALETREKRAQGSTSARKQLREARAAYTKALEKEGSLIRDDKKGRSKTTADRDEEFVAGLERDEKGNLNEASDTESTGPTEAESLFDSGRDEDEEAGRAIDEQLGNADTAEARRNNEDRSTGKTKFGKDKNLNPDGTAKDPYTAEKLIKELSAFVRTGSLGNRVVVVDSVDDLINSDDAKRQAVGREIKANGAFAAVDNYVAYMIADRINKGEGPAKFLHEVGAHLGMEGLLGQKRLTALANQIRDWLNSDADTNEVTLANRAMQRVMNANTSEDQRDSELIAYFIEEAVSDGLFPTAANVDLVTGPLRQWFRTLWAAFKVAVRTLGIKPENLTAQNVVDLAYGAARLEVNGVFHGTAAAFKRFSNAFINTGEKAQAYGWGSYLAQAYGIGKGYFVNDVGRKTFQAASKGLDGLTGDFYLSGPVLDPETMQEIFPAGTKLSRAVRRRLGQLHLERGIDRVTVETADGPVELDLAVNPPKGNLLRVDTAVAPDEMLDWDAPMRKQPAIREKVQRSIPQDLLDQVFEETNTDIDDITGADLYRGLTVLEEREGLVSEFAEKDTVHEDAQRTVSEYLESIGIKGLQYLDNPSRTERDPAKRNRNLVIFNDKDIQRVASKVGNSRSNIKFGIGSSTASNANTQTQPVATAEKAIRAYPPALRPAARAVHRVLGKYARGALNTVMFTEDLMNRAIDLGMKSAKAYKDLANQKESFTGSYERRVLNTVSGYTDLPEKIKGKGPGTVNAFLQDSQMQSEFAGKWGYQPSWLDKVEIDPKAKAAYEALGDKGMAYADAVFKLGHDTLALKKQTVIESTTSEYDVLIAAAKKDGSTKEVAELTDEKTKTLEQFGTMMKLGGKFPYSPVKRFGNYVVVAESQKYIDARKAGDTKLMRQLEGDPNEYFVDFAESDGDAQKIEDELRATGLYVDPGYRPRETMRDDLYGGSNTLKALSKLRERAAAMPEATSQDKQTKEAATKLRTLLTDLYLMQLAEGSSRKSEMKRRGVAGNIDMIRSLETQGKADAHFLGSVKFGGKMLESIGEMRKEMRDGTSDQRLRRSEVLNEVIARHMQSMDYKETPLVDALRMVPSVFFLAMSPSYYIQNALQPFMLSLPLMAAKHGYGKTSKALVDAYTGVAPAFKNADVLKQIDFDALLAPGNNALTKDEKVMVQSLLDSGRLDIGMATEFGSLRADGDGKVSAAWNKARDGLTGLQSKMEALNRLSTALAAFRLESGSGTVNAAAYADRIIQESHGDYNAQNAPRAFNTAWGKIGLQFKKYQLIQLTLMAKLLNNSFGEAKTKEEKDARTLARKALAYTMGQAAVIGGGKALPIPFVVAWLFGAAFGDDSDEPPEYVLRQMIGNKDIADLLISGPLSFAGINGSGLGGFGNAVAALPFVDVDLTSREGVMETAFAIGAGPLGGLALKTADGVGAMTNGDYFKGLGMLLPKGPGSFIKAGEQKINGIYQRDGDSTMSADEISGWATFQQAMGFTPQQTLERQYRQQAAYKIDGSMKDQNSEIKRMYSRALKDGESTTEAKEAWLKYQAKRVNMGYERQPMSELTKSAQTQSKREKETVGGVQYKKNNEQFVRELNAY